MYTAVDVKKTVYFTHNISNNIINVKISFTFIDILQHTETAVNFIVKANTFVKIFGFFLPVFVFLPNYRITQIPNYRNSLGMRHNSYFVLLFIEVYKLEG